MSSRYIPSLPHVTWDAEMQQHLNDAEKCVDLMVKSYMEAAYWTDAGPDAEQDIRDSEPSDEAWETARFDCVAFLRLARWHIKDWSMGQLGHDFWLTRNHHGAGFWDRDFGTEASRTALTDLSHLFGEQYLVCGDDGKGHLE